MRKFSSLSWRNIRSRPVRATLNAIGIVLGVGLIFAVTALSTNLVNTFDSLFDSIYGETDLIVGTENNAGLLPDDTLTKIRATDGVQSAGGTISSVLVLVKDGKVSKKATDRMYVGAADPEGEDFTGAKIVAGRDVAKTGNELVIDKTFADKQELSVGDEIEAAAPSGVIKLTIVGIERYKNDFSLGGQGLAGMPLTTARTAFDLPKGYNEIDIKAAGDQSDVAGVKKNLVAALGEGVDVSTPKDLGDEINDSLGAFNIILGFFAGIAVFVGGFLILNSFAMTIAQRIREIGMLRTMGAGRKQVTRSILREAAFLGLFGSLLGIGVGMLLTLGLIKLVESFGVPFSNITYPTIAFVLSVGIGVAATIVAAWQPARKAGRVSPMEAVSEEPTAEPPKIGRRAAVGLPLIALGLAGAWVMVTSNGSGLVVVAGIGGVFALFTGAILIAPAVIPWIARALAPFVRIGGKLEGRIAVDTVIANNRRSAATASILMVGIAMVATFGSVASSSIATVKKQLDAAFQSDFAVRPINADQGGGPQSTISPRVTADIAKIKGVKVVAPERTLWLSKGFDDTDNFVRAIDPAAQSQVENPTYVGATEQEAYAGIEDGGVAISEAHAKTNDLAVGDTITVTGLSGSEQLPIVALDSGTVQATVGLTMSLDEARKIYGLNQDSSIAIGLVDGANTEQTRSAIEAQLKDYPQLEVSSTAELKDDIEKQQQQGLSFFYALMFVAILIGLFGVMNTMFISVITRTREVGVLRAIGARRRQIRKTIRRESIILTVAGTVMGLVVGLILGRVFVQGFNESVTNSVYALPWGIIITSAILSVIFGVIAAGLPARRAARTNVVEAVSYE